MPPAPASLAYLLEVFFRLRRRKASSGFSIPPIEWPDIDAFVRNAQVAILPWELAIIERLDDLYVREMNSKPTDTDPPDRADKGK